MVLTEEFYKGKWARSTQHAVLSPSTHHVLASQADLMDPLLSTISALSSHIHTQAHPSTSPFSFKRFAPFMDNTFSRILQVESIIGTNCTPMHSLTFCQKSCVALGGAQLRAQRLTYWV